MALSAKRSFAVQRNNAKSPLMKTIALSAIALMLLAASPARADNCAQIANQVAGQYGAEVLAVRAEGASCVIKLRIPGQAGQPPRVETVTVAS